MGCSPSKVHTTRLEGGNISSNEVPELGNPSQQPQHNGIKQLQVEKDHSHLRQQLEKDHSQGQQLEKDLNCQRQQPEKDPSQEQQLEKDYSQVQQLEKDHSQGQQLEKDHSHQRQLLEKDYSQLQQLEKDHSQGQQLLEKDHSHQRQLLEKEYNQGQQLEKDHSHQRQHLEKDYSQGQQLEKEFDKHRSQGQQFEKDHNFESKNMESEVGPIPEPPNVKLATLTLPDLSDSQFADFPCLYSYGRSKWPIRCYAPLHDFNVNAGHGGCASLVFISNSYGGKGAETTAEVQLLRSGFDCNHFGATNFTKSHAGHFGPASTLCTDEQGRLLVDCLFGTNHVMLLSNDDAYGHMGNSVTLDGALETDELSRLPLNINGNMNAHDENGGGVSLLLCSGVEVGLSQSASFTALYMIRSGFKDDAFQTSLVSGEDKWKFEAERDGVLCVRGPSKSHYTLYHNRSCNMVKNLSAQPSKVVHTQTLNGADGAELLPFLAGHAYLLVLCSNSYGTENSTSAALYGVSVTSDGTLSSKLITANHAPGQLAVWTFEEQNGKVVVRGPVGPCRYAMMSTLKEDCGNPAQRCRHQRSCLATGQSEPIRGAVTITAKEVIGVLTNQCQVYIQLDGKVVGKIESSQLMKTEERWAFRRKFMEEETKSPGLYMMRVFAVSEQKIDGKKDEDARIELTGSPCQITVQPKGVIYAVNSGGPAYQALSDIVYASEHGQFASFTNDFVHGARHRTLGGVKTHATLPQLLTGSHDGFLCVTCRVTYMEAQEEKTIKYIVDNLPNGTFTLRFHSVAKLGSISAGGTSVSKPLSSQFTKQKEIMEGSHAHVVECPIQINNNKLELFMTEQHICGFAVLDSSYTETRKSTNQLKENVEDKERLSTTLEPLTRSILRKEMQIVGWSQNLLENASGESGDLSHWNVSGNWVIHDGGYGTEKAFKSSHMDCTKYQEVNLANHFTDEYLDSSPPIQTCPVFYNFDPSNSTLTQVSEWYREGVCGGGFYSLDIALMDAAGNVIKSYSSGRTGKLYRDNQWTEAGVTFTDYGTGARLVGIQSFGKDDKFWAGHYGTIISASVVRVKREVKLASNDQFADIDMRDDGSRSVSREKLVTKVLTDNQDLLSELTQDNVVPSVDSSFDMQTKIGDDITKPRRRPRKQREIRVFVSSTFKDMQGERERLIKKTFRELNSMCAERGVFFTYVDLRWGISSEQTSHGQTISICLQEIERCRPYFVCMLGERFGWCQREEKPDKLLDNSYNYAIENFPSLKWLDQYRFDTSVTKLEVLKAVLNDVDSYKDRSFFYLRAPVSDGYMGLSSEELKDYKSESDWHGEKQHDLRKSIEDQPVLHTRYYNEPDDVCTLIKKDLAECIDADFPRGSEPTALEREREAHLAFADVRCRVYIGRPDYSTKMEDYFSEHRPQPLVILGESGSGKSALVANWTRKTEEKNPNAVVFVHFIGSSAESASYIKLLRRLYEELKEYFHLDQAIPSTDTEVVRDLPKWLTMAGSRARCFLVFDALNQLDDGSGAEGGEHDLLWIPNPLPPNIYMLLSTLPGRAFEAVQAAGWPNFEVKPLHPSEKGEIITGYLEGIYGKTLNEEQKGLMIEAPQTNNPLYLRALLDEVRMYGSFSSLTDKLREYLTASSPGDLFAKILERLEGDFEKEEGQRTNLVRDTTTAIWCSNRGMSESELIELLDINSATWSPFYLSLAESLVNRNGILNFFHDHLRHAVETKYLSTVEAKKQGYLKLAKYFSDKKLDNRVVDELPFLLAKSGELERLREMVTDLEVFRKLVSTEDGKFNLIKSWKILGDFNQVNNAYLGELEKLSLEDRHKDEYRVLLDNLGDFFLKLGLLDASRRVFEELLRRVEEKYRVSHSDIVYNPFNYSWRQCCSHPEALNALQRLGMVCVKQSDLEQATKFYKEAIHRQNRVETPAQELMLCEGLLGLAEVCLLQEDVKEAKKLLVRSRELATSVLGPRHHYVAAIISKLGHLCYVQGRVDEALGYFLQDLRLTRGEVGTVHPRTATILVDVGLVYDDRSDPLAGQLYEAALAILLDMYGPNHTDVADVRYNLGAYYFATNYYARAKFQFTEAYNIYTSFLGPDHRDTIATRQALEAV